MRTLRSQCLMLMAGASAFTISSMALASEPNVKAALNYVGVGLALFGGLVQLFLGVALAIVAISLGFRIVGRVMPGLNIIDLLKKKNRAVGVMAAGVVVAYTKVISTGIVQIGESLSVAPSISSFVGGIVNVAIGVALASIGVTWAFKALDRVTPGLDLSKELESDNLGVGIFVAGVLYGVSSMIAAAVSGIGQALASAMSGLF